MQTEAETAHYRAVFLSDIHLGTPGCQADLLLDFLRHARMDALYLVGDIYDGWRMRRSWYWPQTHNDVVQKILRHARKGTRVTFIPGNHDESARDYCGTHFGGIEVMEEAVHVGPDGRRYLVIHGDAFDGVVLYARWLAVIGDVAYEIALKLNTWFNAARRRLGLPYWSVSAYLKHKVKNAVQFIANFESTLSEEALKRGFDGVICGHIHHAEIRDIGPIRYMNDGDWVESCTALVEHADGRFEILRWAEQVAERRRTADRRGPMAPAQAA